MPVSSPPLIHELPMAGHASAAPTAAATRRRRRLLGPGLPLAALGFAALIGGW
jgi:hypothetical protein